MNDKQINNIIYFCTLNLPEISEVVRFLNVSLTRLFIQLRTLEVDDVEEEFIMLYALRSCDLNGN